MKPLMLKYYNYPHVVNNLVMMTVICALSMLYYRSVSRLSDISNRLLRWVQKSLFIQCAVAWTFDIVVSLTHIYIQFFHKPSYIALIATIGWQLGHGQYL
ncbi:hypothetical protein ANCCAN_16746 [Ancylostoma caninum]|uniref:7TM GPCR serpentine receptor class x (Srx) domain-containing protein n=1 Tax=Ancylostoma caninum TaxID=29170 RepID=A0A368FYU3_ANCCA|nr:hypothetical protein ANCCAN_16746 [Ancylostoma caninum]